MKLLRGMKLSGVWLELGGIGHRFNLTPTCSTRVSNNVDLFPRWRKPLLRPRPGEGGQESGHPAQGRAFLRWSACYVVWQKITARHRPGTVYAAFCVFDYALELTDNCGRRRESGTHSSSHKELAYLAQFGQPLLPFRRERRDGYQYQEQSPSVHIENLKRYLLIASSLVPRDSSLGHFCIRHPDLQQSNIVVLRSSDSGWQLVSDWPPFFPRFSLLAYPNTSRTTKTLSHDL